MEMIKRPTSRIDGIVLALVFLFMINTIQTPALALASAALVMALFRLVRPHELHSLIELAMQKYNSAITACVSLVIGTILVTLLKTGIAVLIAEAIYAFCAHTPILEDEVSKSGVYFVIAFLWAWQLIWCNAERNWKWK